MITYLNQKKGQSTLEYAILIIIIITALLSIQTYIKRGVQGRLKSSSDDIGDQYSPGNTNVIEATKVSSSSASKFGVTGQGAASSVQIGDAVTNTIKKSTIVNTEFEYYGTS
jgi:uncharacterized protein (UPF0333 family)